MIDLKYGEERFKASLVVRYDGERHSINGNNYSIGGNFQLFLYLITKNITFSSTQDIPGLSKSTFRDGVIFLSPDACIPILGIHDMYNVEILNARKEFDEFFAKNSTLVEEFAEFNINEINLTALSKLDKLIKQYPDNLEIKKIAEALNKAQYLKLKLDELSEKNLVLDISKKIVSKELSEKEATPLLLKRLGDNILYEDLNYMQNMCNNPAQIRILFWRFLGIKNIVDLELDLVFSF